MISINFKIVTMPLGAERYRLIADTEGELVITKNGQCIFSHGEILLVEFARVLGEWLKLNRRNVNQDFVYNSMDFEQEPVVAFRQKEAGDLLIETSLLTIPESTLIKPDELITASTEFLQKLHDTLVREGVCFENYDAFEVI